jgi:hypothetical protein
MSAVELVNKLQTSFGLELPSTLLFDYPNLDAMAEHLERQVFVVELTTRDDAALHSSVDAGTMITIPSREDLAFMDLEQLSRVKNFTVECSGVGKLVFPGLTNLNGVKVDEVVVVKNGMFRVYPKKPRPPPNTGLNKLVHVTVNKRPENDDDPAVVEAKLRSYAEKQGGTHLKYDHQSFEWTFIMENAEPIKR